MKVLKFIFEVKVKIVTLISLIFFYLLFKGRLKVGPFAKFRGFPALLPLGGLIRIGAGTRLASSLLSNLLGNNHRVIIATISEGEITIGNNFRMSGGSIVSRKKIIIGSNVNIGVNCLITDSDHHAIDWSKRGSESVDDILSRTVTIEDDVWLGANVTILKGVKVGARSVIGAGEVVKKDILPDSVFSGGKMKVLNNATNA